MKIACTIEIPDSALAALLASTPILAPADPATPAPTPAPSIEPPPVATFERFPGVLYRADADPTRGDIMQGQDERSFPILRYVDAGYNVQAWGPINRRWKTRSMYARVFGQGHQGIFDNCNGHKAMPPMPDYSAAGWPLRYPLDADGKAIGPGVLQHDDRQFATDADVATYLATPDGAAPPTPVAPFDMKDVYASYAEIKADAEKYSNVVKVDGVAVPVAAAKFGPAAEFYIWSNGTIRRDKPAVTGGGDEPVEIQ